MRLAVKWVSGDMGDTEADGVVRSLSSLQYHDEALEGKACQFLDDFKQFFRKHIVDDDVIKRLCKITCVNSFSLTNEYGTSIGISLCIRLSAIDHSCRPNMRYAYRGATALMVPTLSSRIPSSLKEAKHSYINELLPRAMRREILKRDYNFDCSCEGCMDDERNNRMEGWCCGQCKDGWLPPGENSECTMCGWRITTDHYEVCRLAEETAKSGNKVLLADEYKKDAKLKMAYTMMPIFEDALYAYNVLRIPSLRTLFENAVVEKNSEDIIKYGGAMLLLQQQYQDKDDLALCHLKYGLAQAYKSIGKNEKCRDLLEGMSVDFGWRRFNFFDKNVIQDPENPDEKFLGLKDVCVDCWCSGVGGEAAYLGESRGGVFRLGKNLDQYYWRAYQASLTALHAADKYIFSIGEDEEGTNSILRIWERDLHEKNAPVLKREVRLSALYSAGHGSVAACTVAVHSSLSSIAVGFVDGTVFVHQGDVIKDKNLNSRWLRIREASPLDGPVTGIALARLPGERLVVFVVTSKAVNSYVIENKAVSNMLKHDSTGASKDCWIFDERTGSLVVASRDMVFFYEADQCTEADGYRGRCLQLGRSHEKLQLLAIGEHLVLLTKQHALIPSNDETEYMSMVTVYNVKGQYIGFSCSLPSLCRLFTVDQSLMILSKDGTLSELTEKNLNAKLDILFKKNLYDVAVILAKGSRDGTEHLKSIHAKYGDYLYGKGDFNNAVSEYKETIGMLEPSYVIKRYLDGSRLRQLCVYLEALHDTDRYTLHHTNILLNCYAQLEERKKMLKFLEKIANDGKTDMSSIFEFLPLRGEARGANRHELTSLLVDRAGVARKAVGSRNQRD
ncbi:hypothetical protein ANCCEY_14639 [Ancylostoma ceylanicum]|uniref:PEP5/VPS11 N-terminal domain-containing protein n=1 Tax=Ancylostoma ceylanicum TaxID=53326 RepID=A0A0D6L4T1_9BILA|nr:hypothetical protein ANCCEY_14639 [Ancylostoma ceylanicum]